MVDWKAFNEWEDSHRKQELVEMTAQESFARFAALWKFNQQLAEAGTNYQFLVDPETNPHLRDLIELTKMLKKVSE
ncbi:hypothetical protein KJ564_00860 [bacterium]|nr:hypothetical protein [bacterium]